MELDKPRLITSSKIPSLVFDEDYQEQAMLEAL
jgi:hypothetical protein